MKKFTGSKNILKNESGIITLDFIFALALAGSFAIIFFAMSFTLSMVEVGQYITFSAARSFHAANVSREAQIDLGKKKYAELKSTGILKTILNSGWISLGDVQLDDFTSEYPESSSDNAIFVGARVPFKANVLNMRLPVIGNTVSDSATGSATLNAYLMREVSTDECRENFTINRLNQLKALDARYGALNPQPEALITDNGC